jgi:glycogen debranching enzyme
MTISLDLTATPFSRRGCWSSLSYPRKVEHQPLGLGLYLRTNHGRPIVPREILRLQPLQAGREAQHTVSSDGSGIDIAVAGGGRISIVCAGSGTVRIRGSGCAMRLDVVAGPLSRQPMPTVVYALRPGAWAVNMRGALRRYAVVPVSGGIDCDADWEGERTTRATLTTVGRQWEILIDEFQTVWSDQERPSFAAERAAARRELAAFTAGLPPVPSAYRSSRAAAAYLLWSCTKSPSGNLAREAVFMSLNWMDGVWSWDNLFNLVAIAGTDPELAFAQIAVEADHQDAHGAYPDFLGDLYKHYCFHKPPVHGLLLGHLRRTQPRWFTPARRKLIVDSIGRFTRFWLDHRRWAGDDLAYYLHGNDSGWDNSTLLLAGAPLVSPDLNAFLATQCRFLAGLTSGTAARRWTAEAKRIEAALLRLWDGDRFVGEHLPDRRRIRSESLVDCMPIVLGRRLPQDIAAALVARIRTFLAPAGLATEQLTSPHYTADGYWRGPVWGPSTLLIWLGLRDLGENALARDVAARYCQTCVRSGFAENFDATTGAALRDPGYTWTASAFLVLAGTLDSPA